VGRELTFADAKIIDIVNKNFVPVAMDDWFQRRRQDAEGEFFRKVADQGPRKGQGGSTRQGIYAFTADGKLLQYRNSQDPDVMRAFLLSALKTWNNLPAAERRLAVAAVPELKKVDPRYVPTLAKDTLILNVHARILDREDHFFCLGSCKFPGGQRASHDHLWIRAAEWQALLPLDPQKEQEIAIPAQLMYRLARYHLIDNTRGEPPMWARSEVRKAELKLNVAEITKDEVRLKLTGAFLLATDADIKTAKRGYDVSLLGEIRYDPATRKITKWNAVALGEHWGEGGYTGGARPGRTPFGVAFELADPTRPADRVPPQAIRESTAYYEADR
jgi:hypothetical protein